MKGIVYLVGAGPGDPELISVRGARLIALADVLVHDRLVSPVLLEWARPDAERIDVGKRSGGPSVDQSTIQSILVDRARQGLVVVRLKGGDPFVFGRGGEELRACRAAGVPCEVVPGISSALAAPAAIGVPLTLRGASRQFAVITAHDVGDDSGLDFGSLARFDTLVVLMGRSNLALLCLHLMLAGVSAETPAACVQWATTARQRSLRASLSELAQAADAAGIEAPSVVIIGAVAALAEEGGYSSDMPGCESGWPTQTGWLAADSR